MDTRTLPDLPRETSKKTWALPLTYNSCLVRQFCALHVGLVGLKLPGVCLSPKMTALPETQEAK